MSISNIRIKRVVRKLDLGEYQEEYAGITINVWVNPPMKISQQVAGLLQKWQKASLKCVLLKKEAGSSEKSGDISEEKASKKVIEQAEALEEAAKLDYYSWFAQVWEDSTESEVHAMVEKLENEEPGMLIFLRDRTLRMIAEYLHDRKKA